MNISVFYQLREGIKGAPVFYQMKLKENIFLVHLIYEDLPNGELMEDTCLDFKIINDIELYLKTYFKEGYVLLKFKINDMSDFNKVEI